MGSFLVHLKKLADFFYQNPANYLYLLIYTQRIIYFDLINFNITKNNFFTTVSSNMQAEMVHEQMN